MERNDLEKKLGKHVVIFYNDTPTTVSKNFGVLLGVSENFLTIGDIEIPISKVVRVELDKSYYEGFK